MKATKTRKLLTMLLALVMVLQFLPAGILAFAEETTTVWDFTAEDFAGKYSGPGTYNGLSWTNGKSHNNVYLYASTGTITVPVSGPSKITVYACYEYSFYFEKDDEASVGQKTGSTGQIDSFSYTYTGAAGNVTITVLGGSYLTKIEVTKLDIAPRLTDVWDFGAEQLDTGKYNNMLTVSEINKWFPDTEAGTTGITTGGFTTSDGQLQFVGGGKTNHRLRVKDAAQGLTCYDTGKYLQDADGNTYNGYIYSNSGANSGVQIVISAKAGDILTFVHGSNGGDADVVFEAPSGATVKAVFTAGSDDKYAQISTFYATETGNYKFYYTSEKLVVARIYRESTVAVPVTGTVTAPADLADYSLVFTNTASGAVTEVPVTDGKYTASLNDCYSYTVSLKNANGYIVAAGKDLTIEKNAASAKLDVTVVKADLVTVTGNITGISEDVLKNATITFQAEAIYVPEITITGTAYTVSLEKGVTYDVILSGINDYQLTSTAKVTYEADATADITIAAKPVYNITISPEGCATADLENATFTFTNLNEEGYVYTFTGTEGIALRDGVYAVKVTGTGIYTQKLTSNLKVNGADVTKVIRFSSDITVWDFRTDDYTGQAAYNGLELTGSFSKHGTSYGLQIKNGSIRVPVSGPCEVKVSVGYNWDISFDDGKVSYFDNTNSGDIDVSYSYAGSAGFVTINVGTDCTSYIKQIQILTAVPYKETLTVGAKGCDYTTIGAALEAIRAMSRPNGERVTVLIQPGNYEEMLVIDVPNVTLKNASENPSIGLTDKGVGIEENAVRITWYYGCGYNYYSMGSDCKYDEELLQVNKENGYESFVNPGDGVTNGSYWNATVVILADGFQASGIIFENSFNQYVSEKAAQDVIVPNSECKEGSVTRGDLPAGSTAVQNKAYVERAAALAIGNNCTEIYFENCKFVGRQDTFYGGKGSTVALYECSIYGACDYIFGGMTAVFAKCDLVFNTSEDKNDVGYITAAQQTEGRGYLMYNCTITSTTPGVDTASEYTSKPGYFGRPWQANTSEVIFYNTIIEAADEHWADLGASLIRAEGWLSSLGGESAITGEFGTYEMADVDNSAARAKWAQIFTEEKCADGTPMTIANFLGDWDAFAGKDLTVKMPGNEPVVPDQPIDPTGDSIWLFLVLLPFCAASLMVLLPRKRYI